MLPIKSCLKLGNGRANLFTVSTPLFLGNILILCSDGLTGLKEAISEAFPKTEHQRCIVHMVRNMLKYIANRDIKNFAKNLRTIYTAPDEKAAVKRLEKVDKK